MKNIILDRRDGPMLEVLLLALLMPASFAAYLFLPGIKAAAAFAVFYCYLFGPFTIVLHNVVHRDFFVNDRLGKAYVHFVGFFLGHSPMGFGIHHTHMHHAEQNGWSDASSTLGYQRDSITSFLRYMLRFLCLAPLEAAHYHYRRGARRLAWRLLLGEVAIWVFALLAPALMIPVILVSRIIMITGNWGQHVLVDIHHPTDPYRNSVTCINTSYNQHCFNDGYHATHHLQPKLHWADIPKAFEENRQRYLDRGALVFSGVNQYQIAFMLLMGQHRRLACHIVGVESHNLDYWEDLLKARSQASFKIRNQKESYTGPSPSYFVSGAGTK